MALSQKCQYSLRAMFELAKRHGQGPVKASAIAETQEVPARFLEVLLAQLKQGGFVESRRGREGGYWFAGDPSDVTVGQIIRFADGSISPIDGLTDGSGRGPSPGAAFMPLWDRVSKAISGVYDTTSFQDLVDRERETSVPSYDI